MSSLSQPDANSAGNALGELCAAGNRKVFALALTTTAAATAQLQPGVYLVFVEGGVSTASVAFTASATATSPAVTIPASGSGNVSCEMFRSDSIERIRVSDAQPYLFVKLTNGTGTLYLSPLPT